jgi:type II secretory pathway pseudopilin PulG
MVSFWIVAAIIGVIVAWLVGHRRHARKLRQPFPPGAVFDENVQFTVKCPRELALDAWTPLLVFAHLSSPRIGDRDMSDPIEEVRLQAERLLAARIETYRTVTQDAERSIPRHGSLTIVPLIEGIEFNPNERSFRWEQPIHCEQFQIRTLPGVSPGTARGCIFIYLERLIVAEITLAVPIVASAHVTEPRSMTEVSSRPYRRIFASYSRKDVDVVEEVERLVETLGDRYMRDVRDVRSGEEWNPRLEELIRSADVFQLFWSWNSLQSQFVRREWEFALRSGRRSFVRPVYWQVPFPETEDLPPPSLRRLGFHQLALPAASPPQDAPKKAPAIKLLAESAIVVALVGVIAGVAVPGLLRSRVAGNEASAIGVLRTMSAAQEHFASISGGGFGSVECLQAPTTCLPQYTGEPFLPPHIVGTGNRSGYEFAFNGFGESPSILGTYGHWTYTATPSNPGSTGRSTFCVDDTKLMCIWEDGRPPRLTKEGQCDPMCNRVQ